MSLLKIALDQKAQQRAAIAQPPEQELIHDYRHVPVYNEMRYKVLCVNPLEYRRYQQQKRLESSIATVERKLRIDLTETRAIIIHLAKRFLGKTCHQKIKMSFRRMVVALLNLLFQGNLPISDPYERK